MCGIFVSFGDFQNMSLAEFMRCLHTLKHRGPDGEGYTYSQSKNIAFGHVKLSIIDVNSTQPFTFSNGNILVANGEIYNSPELRKRYSSKEFRTKSDCEVINHVSSLDELSGMYAFVRYNHSTRSITVGRDPIGIVSLYYALVYTNGVLTRIDISSELKSLDPHSLIRVFPPGEMWECNLNNPEFLFKMISSRKSILVNTLLNDDWEFAKSNIRDILVQSVKQHCQSDVGFGVLLSGGLDSSLIAGIVRKLFPTLEIHSFSVGLENAPDLIAARKVATFLNLTHHEIIFTKRDAFEEIPNVIRSIETFDVTTIRASTPMWIMARYITSLGIKVVLSGEGADEIFGGYGYFRFCPSPEEMLKETRVKLSSLHSYDCLRAHKSLLAFGVECRPPFLGDEFVSYAMRIPPRYKMSGYCKSRPTIEKNILRQAFDDLENPYIPRDILYRSKMQMSDAVGFGWIDYIKSSVDSLISDDEFSHAGDTYPQSTPKTKEAYYYRRTFEKLYPNAVHTVPYEDSIACSSSNAIGWSDTFTILDPSGRSIPSHESAFS